MMKIEVDNRYILYNEFLKDISSFKEYCFSNGVRKGSSILLQGNSNYELVVAYFSLISIDTTIIPTDDRLSDKELIDLMNEIDVDFVIAENNSAIFADKYIPLVLERSRVPEKTIEEFNFEQWRKRSDALILFTSGSSGKPKVIVKSGEVFISNIKQTIKAMQYQQEIFLPLLPYTHFYGLSILLIWFLTKGTLTIYKHNHPRNTLYKLISSSATIIDAAPSLYTSLIKYIENRQFDVQNQFDNVKMWCVGGAPLTKGLEDKFKNLFHKPLLNGYGLTEIGNVALANLTNNKGCGNILPPFQVRIYNESKEELSINEVGEISIYVPFNINNHRNDLLNSNGWYHTGDLGYLDKDYNLFVIGRSKPGVKRMGIMIQPHIIELEIQDLCKNIGQVKVVTVEDDLKGVALIFFIVDFENVDKFRTMVVSHLAEVCRPDRIIPLDEFPLNRNGKVDVKKLEEMALQYRVKA